MRSFVSMTAFASIAFAAVASAFPTIGTAGVETIPPPPEAKPFLAARTDVNVIDTRDPAKASFTALSIENRDETTQGIPDILFQLNGKIAPLCHDLNEKVTGAENLDAALQTSLDILGQIKDLLNPAKGEIEALVANPVESVFYLNGKLLNAHAIAQILAVLTVTVTTALGFVIKACINVEKEKLVVLVSLVNEIAAVLAAIIGLLVKVIATLIADLTPLIHCAFDIIKYLKLTALAEVLKVNI